MRGTFSRKNGEDVVYPWECSKIMTGYIGVLMSMLFFGSNFVVVKRFDSGDGVFFQLFMCMGIWTVGLVVQLIQGSPKFYPFSMLGGALWATGNVLCVYIIQQIGMGLGLVIWGSTALMVGWATGFFGFFDLEKDELKMVFHLNEKEEDIEEFYRPSTSRKKVVQACLTKGMKYKASFFVTVTPDKPVDDFTQLPSGPEEAMEAKTADSIQNQDIESDAEGEPKSKFKGIAAAVCAGFLFGNNFDPPTYIQQHNCSDGNKCVEHYRGASSEPLDYSDDEHTYEFKPLSKSVFAHFCGIIIMSMTIFLAYSMIMKNKPWVSSELCAPAFLSGCMWALGQVGWFIANGILGYTVAFPLAVIGPGLVGSLWSVFFFKEIRGTRNYLLLVGVFTLSIICAICIVLSKA
eukprot:jgi/Bigna1/139286/aug1.49_g13994